MSKPVVGAKAPPTGEPPPSAGASSMAQRSWNALRRVRRATTGSLALVGLGAVATVAYEWNQMKQVEEDGLHEKTKETKKRVLVIPFHRMTLVERKKNSFDGRSLANLADAEDRMMEVQISDLVQVIHAAAQDPSIVALYGIFGHGFTFRAGGWAHIEEIRNALKVWREAHRSHLEPNLMHDKTLVRRSNATPKPSFAFADSFADPDDKGNKEYLLACAFSHIHMQKNGELNLFGVSSSSPFLRSFMEKYGIKAHVFKHGKFKNFPNMFTENGYTREHAQNVEQMVDQIDRNNRNAVTADRNQKGFDNFVWKMIRNLGSITGPEMLKLGLVDHLATLDPLDGLLQSNQENKDKTGGGNNKEAMKQKWGNETDMDKFEATEQVTFSKYLSTLGKRKKMEERKHKMHSSLQKAADKSSAFAATLGLLGYSAPYYNLKKEEYSEGQEANEKIAVVNIQGSINADVARKTVASLRKIKKDDKVKAVILRLDTPGGSVTASESILQECKDMPQPCIASMGNVCASGGYYVATGCKQIFALPTTITGSIGVFAIKFDLTGLAKKYGISVKHTTTGPYSASFHPFKPLNSLVKTNLNNNVDRYYDYFKSIVAESRSLNLKEVEELAQGKVWTGGQAKLNGLVDELGGLERAVSFAQRQYTDGGVAQVERWPKQEGILEKLQRVAEMDSSSVGNTLMAMVQVLRQEINNNNSSQDLNDSSVPEMNEYDATEFLIQAITNNPRSIESMKLGGVSLTMDESAAMSHLVSENVQRLQQDQLLHPSFWNTR